MAIPPRALDNTLENPDYLLQKCALGLFASISKAISGTPGKERHENKNRRHHRSGFQQ